MTKEEAIEQFKYAIELIKQDGKDYLDERDIPMLEMGIQALENQKTGHWIETDLDIYECSECHIGTSIGEKENFCPYCGAKMGGE